MPERMDTTPLIIEKDRVVRLTRVPLGGSEFNETWLQELLFKHPSLIPVEDIEPVFAPLIPVARELQTPSGPLDILYVSPEGYPTLVETKLWKNPEARRQVVAQAIDYVTQLSKFSYGDLVQAIGKVRPDLKGPDSLLTLMEDQAEELDQPRFIDTLTRNLRRGQMLLLIVGDGIHESVEQMANTLSKTPQLGFTLGLVEMGLYRPSEKTEPLIVQPRIIARTREVVRAIVHIRGDVNDDDVSVTIPPDAKPGAPATRHLLTEESFYSKLTESTSSKTAEDLRTFLELVEARGAEIAAKSASLSLHFEESTTGKKFSFGSVFADGKVDMFYVVYYLVRAGFDEAIGRRYLNDVAALVPTAKVDVWDTRSGPGSSIKAGKNHITLKQLLPRQDTWLEAIDRMISRINAAAGGGAIEP